MSCGRDCWVIAGCSTFLSRNAGILAASISELSPSQIIPPFLHLQRHLANRICSSQSWEEMTLMQLMHLICFNHFHWNQHKAGVCTFAILHLLFFLARKWDVAKLEPISLNQVLGKEHLSSTYPEKHVHFCCLASSAAGHFFSGGFHWRMTSIARTMCKAPLAWCSVSARRFLADIHIIIQSSSNNLHLTVNAM